MCDARQRRSKRRGLCLWEASNIRCSQASGESHERRNCIEARIEGCDLTDAPSALQRDQKRIVEVEAACGTRHRLEYLREQALLLAREPADQALCAPSTNRLERCRKVRRERLSLRGTAAEHRYCFCDRDVDEHHFGVIVLESRHQVLGALSERIGATQR